METKKSHIMDKKTTHDTKVVVECQQENNIGKINQRMDGIDKRMENLQIGFGNMFSEVRDSVESLSKKFDDVMFPSPLHPKNGVISKLQVLSDSVEEVKGKVKTYDETVNDTKSIKSEITKFKTQVTAVGGIFGLIIILIDLYLKLKR